MSIEEGDIPIFGDVTLCSYEGQQQIYCLSKKRGDDLLCLTGDLERDSAPCFIDDPSLFRWLKCVGVVNGIVCLYWYDQKYGLWNPATREFKDFPSPEATDKPHGFESRVGFLYGMGFDPLTNDFKFVRSLGLKESWESETVYEYYLYSLSTNSWRRIEENLPNLEVDYPSADGYFNGVYYWTANKYMGDGTFRHFVVSFDFSTEAFKYVDLPPGCAPFTGENILGSMIGHYMEQLALISRRIYLEEHLSYFEIRVVSKFDEDEKGIPLSWQHVLTIGPIPYYHGISAMALRMDGDILLDFHGDGSEDDFHKSNYKCCFFNPSTHTYKKLGLSFNHCYRYVESLFPLSKRQLCI